MATKVDGRPRKIDVLANPLVDAPAISMTGFPVSYLDGATITASVITLAGAAAAANWTVTTGATSIVLSMPQADVAAIGQGRYMWTLVVALASGGKPSTIGGVLSIHPDHKPTSETISVTFGSDPVGVDIVIEQLDLDGGGPEDDDGDDLDGGTL